jgi:hypothetical protein
MRLGAVLALLATACSVPEVSFYPDDAAGNPEGATSDAGASDALDASEGAIGPSDAPYDGPDYCAPDGAAGVLCSGNCGAAACSMCVGCALPNICCTKAGHGTCESQCQ